MPVLPYPVNILTAGSYTIVPKVPGSALRVRSMNVAAKYVGGDVTLMDDSGTVLAGPYPLGSPYPAAWSMNVCPDGHVETAPGRGLVLTWEQFDAPPGDANYTLGGHIRVEDVPIYTRAAMPPASLWSRIRRLISCICRRSSTS